jgi:hypothetical protein
MLVLVPPGNVFWLKFGAIGVWTRSQFGAVGAWELVAVGVLGLDRGISAHFCTHILLNPTIPLQQQWPH